MIISRFSLLLLSHLNLTCLLLLLTWMIRAFENPQTDVAAIWFSIVLWSHSHDGSQLYSLFYEVKWRRMNEYLNQFKKNFSRLYHSHSQADTIEVFFLLLFISSNIYMKIGIEIGRNEWGLDCLLLFSISPTLLSSLWFNEKTLFNLISLDSIFSTFHNDFHLFFPITVHLCLFFTNRNSKFQRVAKEEHF